MTRDNALYLPVRALGAVCLMLLCGYAQWPPKKQKAKPQATYWTSVAHPGCSARVILPIPSMTEPSAKFSPAPVAKLDYFHF